MTEYFNISFVDASSVGSFTARLLKLTRVLLQHFLEVPQSQKAPLCEPIPRFDTLLEFIKQVLNHFNAE